MKKAVFCVAMAAHAWAFGQSVPNAGFEEWAPRNSIEDPVSWESYNFGGHVSVTKTTDAHSGNYAVKCTTSRKSSNGSEKVQKSGVTLGQLIGNTFEMGMQLEKKPDSLVFWAKYTPASPDDKFSVNCHVIDFVTGTPEYRLSTEFTGDATQSYQRFAVPVYAEEALGRVLLLISFHSSSGEGIAEGSTLWLDDLELVTNQTKH